MLRKLITETKMKIFPATEENLKTAAELLKKGKLIAFPTETVYGLGANGLDPIASASIFAAKARPAFNPLILHVTGEEMVARICTEIPESVIRLMARFSPGPITYVLPKSAIVPDIVTSGNPTVAIRIPSHPVALRLIELAGVPVAAPSANKFNKLSPTDAKHVAKQFTKEVDMILDGGVTPIGVESTIVTERRGKIVILRHGGVPEEEIEEFLGYRVSDNTDSVRPDAPGQLKFHYAPSVPITFRDEKDLQQINLSRAAALRFGNTKPEDDKDFRLVLNLSVSGDLKEASSNLFRFLHELENEDIDLIIADRIKASGLGKAIMDRLTKAVNYYKLSAPHYK